MAQRTTTIQTAEAEAIDVENTAVETTAVETTPGCCHHWVIQPADGPVSNGSCQVCGETREFKNYVESATWGDSRSASKGSAVSESTSDDEDNSGSDPSGDESETGAGPNDPDVESED